jgi:hypothetical protein
MPSSQVRRSLLCESPLVTSDILYTKPLVHASDILVDGFIAGTFTPQDAHDFFALLLKSSNFLRHYHIFYSKGVWYATRNLPYVQSLSPAASTQNPPLPLDYSVRTTRGTVIPQRRWAPAGEVDVYRHVECGALQPPIFFINQNGGAGFWLPDILQGRHHELCDGDRQAQLGGKTTTHIRINVSSHTHVPAAKFSSMLLDLPRSGLDIGIGSARYPLETRPMRGSQSHLLGS